MSAVLFGSISTVADTSELQREAFNRAFSEHGLDWRWDREDYRAMLSTAGGRDRIAEHARSLGQDVDADAVHATKSRIFQESLAGSGIEPRPGVVETVRGAREQGLKVGLVTTTTPVNVAALLDAPGPELGSGDFDVVVDSSSVERPKPDRAAYDFAVRSLGEQPGSCVAVEDNVDGVRAAAAAGVTCVAFPNANTGDGDFGAAATRVDHLQLDVVRGREWVRIDFNTPPAVVKPADADNSLGVALVRDPRSTPPPSPRPTPTPPRCWSRSTPSTRPPSPSATTATRSAARTTARSC